MNAELLFSKRWSCPTCGDDHSKRVWAVHCCEPEPIEHEPSYACGACQREFSSETKANECCTDSDFRKKLEAAGQTRIFGD